ncbi:uncharacterized protein J7T54_001669 [Emericellopsis cladophorae]|uniref:DUF1765-domain-containing protein n=1 Tax=Emericellopsis cladophorae TaxID=2686198 RepID=A0A9P9Y570_9HYPO|nr:uncharacterized protein J7T54_001669 [Emericellopsis cladophorae]KAI6783793.1 hypothetical protein J7T54_001669 [Emericellopsis cladophorae]
MSGSTVFMAPAVESSNGLPRSHSTPELMSMSSFSFDTSCQSSRATDQEDDRPYEVPNFDNDFKLDTSFFLSDASRPASQPGAPSWRPAAPRSQPADSDPQTAQPPALRRSRAGSLMERPRSWFPTTAKAPVKEPADIEQQQRPATSVGEEGVSEKRFSSVSGKTTAVQDSLVNFAKRSWLSSSPSPSPKRRPNTAKDKQDKDMEDVPKLAARSPSETAAETRAHLVKNRPSEPTRPSKALNRASSYFSKMKSKPKVFNAIAELDNSCTSSVSSLGPSASTTTDDQLSQAPTVTDDSSAEMPPLPKPDRDPLWSSFKNLEVEFKGFTAKSTSQRVAQLQTLVLPFLRSTMGHASNKKLSPEDIDRRAVILDKWWNGLLGLMDGVGMGSVPGIDRHVVFDTLTTIMVRPEWRQTTPYFLPLADRAVWERQRSERSAETTEATDSDHSTVFLVESAEHNVRTMFITNLARQMGFVVEKMAARHSPQALVTFAGATCAYAFFFVPGVADILVRLWGIGPGLIRRAADAMGLPRRYKGEGGDTVAMFPPQLASLSWTSPKSMWNTLKRIPNMPMVISRVQWMGPWVSRWKGRESDLLFVFYKEFHALTDDFLPSKLPLVEKARAPGFALVHAQLLSIIDDTIHRQAAMDSGLHMMDPMPGADASAMAMTLPPANLMKGMSENNVIILLKDFMSNALPGFAGARHTFAETCAAIIKAAVMKTSQFDTAACFTMCDFLEEALAIYDDYEDPMSGSKSYIDWPFWMDVFKRAMRSMNTMSEVRVLSFIYTVWPIIVKDQTRKASVCLDWLLTEEVFDSFFNHWCPMVRSYYHRLLCWRICRCVGDADAVDTNIYTVVSARLKTAWSHYLHLKQSAEEAGRCPPSTAPTVPTPGKKFMIIRQEVSQPQPGLFANFDSFSKATGLDVVSADEIGEGAAAKPEAKKKGSLLGKIMSLAGSNPSKGHDRRSSWDEEFINARRETAEARHANAPSKISTSIGSSDSDSSCSSPTYEESKYIFKFFLAWHQPSMPPRDRVLTRPRLPAPAQAVVSLRALAGGTDKVDNRPAPLVKEAMAHKDDGDSGPPEAAATESAEVSVDEAQELVAEPITEPVKPAGLYVNNAVYTGRALAEWGQVIWECNNFADRRRDEGVPGIAQVEVPLLGVESFRKPGC